MTSSSWAADPRAAPWRTGCPPTRARRVLVLEAGRPDYIWDPFIHMPAALTFPIGNRFYDWKYESEPEPYMNGRRIYHARGKVLGGSSSINGMIFQRGNPLDYERWAADPGMATGTTRTACRTSSGWRTAWPADADEPFRGHTGPLVLERGPATSPLFERVLRRRAAGRLPAHRRRERLPAGGLRRLRPQRPPGPAAVRRAGLPASGDGPAEPDRGHPRARSPGSSSAAPGRSASSSGTRARPSGSGRPR